MGVEYYLADTKNRRVYSLGKSPGRIVYNYLWTTPYGAETPLDVRALAVAYRDGWASLVRDGRVMPESDADLNGFAAQVWAFCATAGWQVEPFSDARFTEKYDGWPTVASWYTAERLDPDPVAYEQARWEAEALAALA